MKKRYLINYARLIALMGVNVQKGQEVDIIASLDQPEFVEILTEECYRAGAGKVTVQWTYSQLEILHYKWQTQQSLNKVNSDILALWKHREKVLPCIIWLDSDHPDGLNGIDRNKYTTATVSKLRTIRPIRDRMDNKHQWCIAAVPGKKWAQKVFPAVSTARAVELLWKAILSASRALDDPLSAWEHHNANLQNKCDYLNTLGLKSLKYKSSNGTDFSVELIPDSSFEGGNELLPGTFVRYNPNIPSEEIFISPMKGRAEGIAYSTKPLSFNGQIISNFYLKFHEGKVVESFAEQNDALLSTLLDYDEGSRYLGECAFVPYDSPINNSGILFHNTLFDENACCHLALGRGFETTLNDFGSLTQDQCFERGINNSILHVDFMIGSKDLEITGFTWKNRKVALFKDGNWAL